MEVSDGGGGAFRSLWLCVCVCVYVCVCVCGGVQQGGVWWSGVAWGGVNKAVWACACARGSEWRLGHLNEWMRCGRKEPKTRWINSDWPTICWAFAHQ